MLRELLSQTLDRDTFAIADERPEREFLSTTVVVDQQSLSDLSLYAGLKSPGTWRAAAIVDRTARIYEAAVNLIEARFAFDGQSPYSSDIVLVNEFCLDAFLEAAAQYAARYLHRGGSSPPGSNAVPEPDVDYSLLEKVDPENGARVIVSGTGWAVVQMSDR